MNDSWSDALHRRVAAAIKRVRAGRSAQWLADETRRIGFPISRAAIANYESGRKRGLDIAELLVLAAALNVPPLVLLFPELPDGLVEGLPGIRTTSWEAAAWFAGERGSIFTDGPPESPEYGLIRAVRGLSAQFQSIADVHSWMGGWTKGEGPLRPSDPDIRALKHRLEALREEVARLEGVIRGSGGVLSGDLNVPTSGLIESAEGTKKIAQEGNA
jgi:transcriptional regulator with XRE-family HTH domain